MLDTRVSLVKALGHFASFFFFFTLLVSEASVATINNESQELTGKRENKIKRLRSVLCRAHGRGLACGGHCWGFPSNNLVVFFNQVAPSCPGFKTALENRAV